MTVICAAKDASGVWLACDQQATMGGHAEYGVVKWMFKPSYSLAVSGSWWTHQVLENELEDFDRPFDVIDRIRVIAEQRGLVDSKEPFRLDSSLLLVMDGRIYDGAAGLSYVEVPEFAAIGSGAEYAYGVFCALSPTSDMEQLVRTACQAAIRYDTGSGGDIFVGYRSTALTEAA